MRWGNDSKTPCDPGKPQPEMLGHLFSAGFKHAFHMVAAEMLTRGSVTSAGLRALLGVSFRLCSLSLAIPSALLFAESNSAWEILPGKGAMKYA